MGAFYLPPNSRFRVRVPLSLDKIARQTHGVGFLFGGAGMSRKTVGAKLRRIIFERDNFSCRYCGENANSIDHVYPVDSGGTDDPTNLVACCHRCNNLASYLVFLDFEDKQLYLVKKRMEFDGYEIPEYHFARAPWHAKVYGWARKGKDKKARRIIYGP